MQGHAHASIRRKSFNLGDRAGRIATAMCLTLLACMLSLPALASTKHAALVIDGHTGQVLYSRNADEARYPASLTKVMTLYLLFEKLEKGEATLKSRITMTQRGANQPPSKLGLGVGQTLTVEDAILALVTRSANDVASATGAFIAGSEDNFAALMTKKARELGMSKTTYKNASGLPDKAQVTTARDQATLAMRMREDFPQYYHYFSTEYFTWGKARIHNHNRLLGRYQGATGLKTGYTRASGFNLTTTVEREDKYLVGVVMGGEQAKTRDDHMVEILDRAYPRAIAMKAGTTQVASAQRKQTVAAASSIQPVSAPQPVETVALAATPTPVHRPAGIVPAEDRAALLQLASAIEVQDVVEAPVPAPQPAPVQTAALTSSSIPANAPFATVPGAPAAASKAPVDSATAYAVSALRSAEGPVRQVGREIGNFLVPPANAAVAPAEPLTQSALNDPARTEPQLARDWRDGDPLIPEGTWVIQIGAYASEADAVESIRKAVRAAPEELGKAVPVTIPVTTAEKRTLYRSRFGGFEGEQQARNACGRLARQSIQCIPIPPTNWAMPNNPEAREKRRG
ncbi:MAG: SPOR domain-containing protein [Parvibaculaceae bacterium]|nr:SPOR domain-containing protein [Parvibaculaceae bacterium]